MRHTKNRNTNEPKIANRNPRKITLANCHKEFLQFCLAILLQRFNTKRKWVQYQDSVCYWTQIIENKALIGDGRHVGDLENWGETLLLLLKCLFPKIWFPSWLYLIVALFYHVITRPSTLYWISNTGTMVIASITCTVFWLAQEF